MKRYIKTTYIMLLVLLAVVAGGALQGCRDDAFDDYNVQYPDGVTNLKINFDFEPLASTKLASRATNAPAGDVVKALKDFSILFYDTRYAADNKAGKLTYIKHFSTSDIENLENGITMVDKDRDRVDANASNGHKAEDKTTHVEALLKDVPYGPYKAYIVANLGVNGATTKSVLDENDVKLGGTNDDPDGLLHIKALWDEKNMLNNSQMTGYFSVGEQTPSPGTGSKAEEISIKSAGMTLHAWLRRLVSKVTVTYDPSGLRKGITVKIKKVTVRDIPMSCYLGLPNKAGNTNGDGLINTDGLVPENVLYNNENNHCIDYGDGGITLTSETKAGEYVQLDNNFNIDAHSEGAQALFFFENMQGEVPDKDNNGKLQDGKLQDENGDGIIDYPGANDPNSPDYKDYKDGLKYGTYIEVEAEYDARTVGHIGRGDIKYRFMIGKNVTTNCDAERNHHYKLKLRFMGNANEVDWHIDYDETPGFYGPNPYYVSYSYNRMTYYPIKISGELEGDVTMTIIQNAWWPNNAKDFSYFAKTGKLKHLTDDGRIEEDSVGVDVTQLYHPSGDQKSLEPWTGFLSLAQDMSKGITNVAYGVHVAGDKGEKEGNREYLYKYWRGENTPLSGVVEGVDYNEATKNDTKLNRGTRVYKTSPGSYSNDAEGGAYTVTKDENSTTINVPFYTREKQLQSTTAYTGNNPYVSYQREAKVELKYRLKGDPAGEYRLDTIKVYQVRRIVNPKGVWRKHNTTNRTFHVNLKYQETETSTDFKSLKSKGPWRAYISAGNTSFINLNGKSEVRGGDGTEIDFNINFKGTIPATDNRCAVIRVEYNNYSSHHLIFVRQGSAPIKLNNSSSVKWHMANVVKSTGTGSDLVATEGDSPLDEGSMFRYGNLTKGVTSLCNPPYHAEIEGNTELKPYHFDPSKNTNPTFAYLSDGSKNVEWNTITANNINSNFPDVKVGDKTCRVATIDDISSIKSGMTVSPLGTSINGNEAIEYGYGVLYGDESTATASTVEQAYGYFIHPTDVSQSKTTGYGMRGLFVYNSSTSTAICGGNNLFFPIGRSGYGRRKVNEGWPGNLNGSNAVLQYAGRNNWYSDANSKYLPLFYDIFRSHGALYWVKKIIHKNVCTMDVNYHTLDMGFASLGYQASTEGNSDACFVRLVEDE